MTDQERNEAFAIAKDVVALGPELATKLPYYCLEKVSRALIEMVKDQHRPKADGS